MNEPSAPPATPEWLRALGPRTTRRPEPRFGVLVSLAGGIIAVVGAIILAVGGDDPNIGLAFIVLVALTGGAYLALSVYKSGPLATAGATASALALPLAGSPPSDRSPRLGGSHVSDGTAGAVEVSAFVHRRVQA